MSDDKLQKYSTEHTRFLETCRKGASELNSLAVSLKASSAPSLRNTSEFLVSRIESRVQERLKILEKRIAAFDAFSQLYLQNKQVTTRKIHIIRPT